MPATRSRKYTTSNRTPPKRITLNLRIRPELRSLIDHAAQLTGMNRTDFMLDAASKAAQETLLDRTRLQMGPKAYASFLERLDAKPRPNARLLKSLRTPAVWD
jgi:uncharacterized protein (DUF1778 family)